MADEPAAGRYNTNVRSFLVWHTILLKEDEQDTIPVKEWGEFWDKITEELHITATYHGDAISRRFPDADQIVGTTEYAPLALRVQAGGKDPRYPLDEEHAYVYGTHDTLGMVAYLISETPDDFPNLEQRLRDAVGEGIPEALGTFLTYGILADAPCLSEAWKREAWEAAPFVTREGFSLWALQADRGGERRVIGAPATFSGLREAVWYTVGPAGYALPRQIEYQISAAKIQAMYAEFQEKYAGNGDLRRDWKTAQKTLEDALNGLNAGKVPDEALLQRLQANQAGLRLMQQDLNRWRITNRVALSRLTELQPVAETTPERTGEKPTFAVFQRDRAFSERLDAAIETENGYITSIALSIEAMQPVYVAEMERERKRRDGERQRLDEERNYSNIWQTSLVGGLGVFLGAVQTVGEHQKDWYGWPGIVLFASLGFAIPAYALRRHNADFGRRSLERYAVAFVIGALLYLGGAALQAWTGSLPPPDIRAAWRNFWPLIIGVLTGALAFASVPFLRPKTKQGRAAKREETTPEIVPATVASSVAPKTQAISGNNEETSQTIPAGRR